MKFTLLVTSLLATLAIAAPADFDIEKRAVKTCQECQTDALTCINAVGPITLANILVKAPLLKKCQDDLNACKKAADKSTQPVSSAYPVDDLRECG